MSRADGNKRAALTSIRQSALAHTNIAKGDQPVEERWRNLRLGNSGNGLLRAHPCKQAANVAFAVALDRGLCDIRPMLGLAQHGNEQIAPGFARQAVWNIELLGHRFKAGSLDLVLAREISNHLVHVRICLRPSRRAIRLVEEERQS